MQKRTALAISVGLHVAFFAALMYAPPLSLTIPEKSPSEYQQLFAHNEDKIVWYKFKKLPDIKPQNSPRADRPLRAAVKAAQAVVSSPKNAPKREQMVVAPVPDIAPPPLDLPNLIAVKLPPKQFVTPPDIVRPDAPKIHLDTIDAPKVPFEPLAMAKLPSERLPGKTFVPPTPTRPKDGPKIAMLEETPVTVTGALGSASLPSSKLPGRAFAPPAKAAAAPPPQIEAPQGDVTIAIASLNPSTVPVQLPSASSPAQFSAGEKVRPEGAASDGSAKGAAVVPDLYARGAAGSSKPKPELFAMTMLPRSTKELLAGGPSISASTPAATHVANAPDPRFNGREVYMMAIQAPNLTSASGSWLMWYADRTARAAALQPLAAPIPRHKVDPRYAPSLIADHVEGRVQLYCVIGREGKVSSIEVIHGADERLNRSAQEALSKWEFVPATRNGVPVDVDVVVEIPFLLTPLAAQ